MGLDKTAKWALTGVVAMFAGCAAIVTSQVSKDNQRAQAKQEAAARRDSIAAVNESRAAAHRENYVGLHNAMRANLSVLHYQFPGDVQRDSAAREMVRQNIEHLSETGASVSVNGDQNEVVFADPYDGNRLAVLRY